MFLSRLFKRKDEQTTLLKSDDAKLAKYEALLVRELKRWESMPQQRAMEHAAMTEQSTKKLMLLYQWALNDLLDTFFKQAVLLHKRCWLLALLDATAVAILTEKLIATRAWRSQLAALITAAPELPAGDVPLLPLDVPAFTTSPSDLIRDDTGIERLQRRIGRLTSRLAEIDLHVQTLKSLFRALPKADRRLLLHGLLVAQGDEEVTEVATEADLAELVDAMRQDLVQQWYISEGGGAYVDVDAVTAAATAAAGTLACEPGTGTARDGSQRNALFLAAVGVPQIPPQIVAASAGGVHPCAPWAHLLLRARGAELFEEGGVRAAAAAAVGGGTDYGAPATGAAQSSRGAWSSGGGLGGGGGANNPFNDNVVLPSPSGRARGTAVPSAAPAVTAAGGNDAVTAVDALAAAVEDGALQGTGPSTPMRSRLRLSAPSAQVAPVVRISEDIASSSLEGGIGAQVEGGGIGAQVEGGVVRDDNAVVSRVDLMGSRRLLKRTFLGSSAYRRSAMEESGRTTRDSGATGRTLDTADAYAALDSLAIGNEEPPWTVAKGGDSFTSGGGTAHNSSAAAAAVGARQLTSSSSSQSLMTSLQLATPVDALAPLLLLYTHGIIMPVEVASMALAAGADRDLAIATALHAADESEDAAATESAKREAEALATPPPSLVAARAQAAAAAIGLPLTLYNRLGRLADALKVHRALKRDREARTRDAHRILADQRTPEGRLLQRWCQRILASGLPTGVSYAFGMTKYMNFDPGPSFIARVAAALRLGQHPVVPGHAGSIPRSVANAQPSNVAAAATAVMTAAAAPSRDDARVQVEQSGVHGLRFSVPTPRTISAFLRHFVVEVEAEYDLASLSAPSLQAADVASGGTLPRVLRTPLRIAAGGVSLTPSSQLGMPSGSPPPPLTPLPPARRTPSSGTSASPTVVEMQRLLRIYADRLLLPRLHSLIFAGVDVIAPPDVYAAFAESATGIGAARRRRRVMHLQEASPPEGGEHNANSSSVSSAVAAQVRHPILSRPTVIHVPPAVAAVAFRLRQLAGRSASRAVGDDDNCAVLEAPGAEGSLYLQKTTAQAQPLAEVAKTAAAAVVGAISGTPQHQFSQPSPLPPIPMISPRGRTMSAIIEASAAAESFAQDPPSDISTDTVANPDAFNASRVGGTLLRASATGRLAFHSSSKVALDNLSHGLAYAAQSLSSAGGDNTERTVRLNPSGKDVQHRVADATSTAHHDSLVHVNIVSARHLGIGHAAATVTAALHDAGPTDHAAAATASPTITPLRPPGSAAELMFRRDGIWQRKRPLVAAMDADTVGIPARFLTPLSTDEIVVTLNAEKIESSGAPSAVLPLSDTDGFTVVRYDYPPFSLPAALLGCIDELTMPSDMLRYVNAAVDAAVAEATARARVASRGDQKAGCNVSSNVTADDLVPLLTFVCSQSSWARPHACLSYCSNYGMAAGASSSGRDAYTLTLIQSCVAWICTRKSRDSETGSVDPQGVRKEDTGRRRRNRSHNPAVSDGSGAASQQEVSSSLLAGEAGEGTRASSISESQAAIGPIRLQDTDAPAGSERFSDDDDDGGADASSDGDSEDGEDDVTAVEEEQVEASLQTQRGASNESGMGATAERNNASHAASVRHSVQPRVMRVDAGLAKLRQSNAHIVSPLLAGSTDVQATTGNTGDQVVSSLDDKVPSGARTGTYSDDNDDDDDDDADAYAELLGEDEQAGSAADDLAALKVFIQGQDAIEGVLRVFG